jgi:UDP-N-acetyl-2-amino-2-deoxyglucuronate dehydrogenase
MKEVNFAVIGYGNIGKRHCQHILQHPQARLKAVCELPLFEKPVDFPKEVAFYDNLKKMLEQETFDVLNVCTPNYLHRQHTIQALEHGKHVVCEKPMAMSTNECDQMIAAANAGKRIIFVVKQNRYNEPVQYVKKLIENNALGRVFMVTVNCFWNRNEYYYHESIWRGKRREDGGCLFTQFSHFVDILYYLIGDIQQCRGVIKNYNHPYIETEDTGSFLMQSNDGALINFNYSTCSHTKNMEGAITILAEKGTVKIGGQYLNTIEYQDIHGVELPEFSKISKPNDYGAYQGSMSAHDKVIENVIRTLEGTENAMTNAEEGRRVVRIIEQMYAST